MKKAKRILVFAILAAMLLSLCGCGMFRTHVAKAAIKMSKLDSLHADIEMQIGMGISVLGQDVNADATVTGGADIQRDPERVYMNMNAEVAGFEQNMLLYAVGRDGGARQLNHGAHGNLAQAHARLHLDVDDGALHDGAHLADTQGDFLDLIGCAAHV